MTLNHLIFILVTIEGERHDSGMLAESGLLQELQNHVFTPAGHPLCLHMYPAYPLRVHLQGLFKGAIITPQMQAFSAAMNTVRISVEWLFGDITNYFKFVDFKRNLKICLSSVGKMYIVCAILHNALTCLCGNQTSSYFDLNPSSLQDYFV